MTGFLKIGFMAKNDLLVLYLETFDPRLPLQKKVNLKELVTS
ncbi:hypothetical protein [Paenibacillus humicola]|nr:hypothetical protein [Paenibacillus humicola]